MPCRLRQPIASSCAARQRLGHQRVVVHRDDVRAHPPQQRREGIGRERDVPRPHRTGVAAQQHVRAVARQRGHRRPLEDAHAERQACRPQPPGQPGRIDERGVGAVPAAAEVRRRVHLRAHGVLVEQHGVVTEFLQHGHRLGQPVELVRLGGDVERSRPVEVAVDAVTRDGGLDRVQILAAEPLQRGQVVGEARAAVLGAVGQGRGAEPAVASRRRPPRRPPLEQHHVSRRVVFLGEQRGPQPGVATAHDREITANRRRRAVRPVPVRRASPARTRSVQRRRAQPRMRRRHAFFLRLVMKPARASATPNRKISVPMTFTCGGTPTRDAPYTHSGNVSVLPLLKLVMM